MRLASDVPHNFRNTRMLYKRAVEEEVDATGLHELRLSGSAQLHPQDFRTMLAVNQEYYPDLLPASVTILDLREEPKFFHGDSTYGWWIPKNIINRGKSTQQIVEDLNNRLEKLKNATVTIQSRAALQKIADEDSEYLVKEFRSHNFAFPVHDAFDLYIQENVFSEEELCRKHGFHYHLLPITDHHAPYPEIVDWLVEILRGTPKNGFIHAHCMAGKGRTTTCMVLIDVFYNGKQVSLQQIAKRHAFHGGLYLDKVPTDPEKLWKTPMALERWSMISRFYEYCRLLKTQIKFSEWLLWKETNSVLTSFVRTEDALLLVEGSDFVDHGQITI